jgi:SHS2 domain-containing protein
MKAFEFLEHTADVKFRAYGRDPEEMLENAALALMSTMADISRVQLKESWRTELEAPDLEHLAYDWLSELIFLSETEGALFSSFQIRLEQNQQWKLAGGLHGEKIDLGRHALRDAVKAVTWHEFQVKKNDIWCLQVVLDV